jgi:3-oxoacyl-[acyl-carrier-protein] synthase-3
MFAIRKTVEQLLRLRDAHAVSERRFHFVGHQANLRMLEAVRRECDVPEDRHHSNVEWFGNTAGASAPSVISMRWDDWRADDDVGVVGVGAGLTWSSYLLRFRTGGSA